MIVAYIIAVVLAGMRIAGHKSQAFQAVAHIYVGWIFTAAYFIPSRALCITGVVLSLVELAVFLAPYVQLVLSKPWGR
jgi:hypothetical protein